MKGNPHYHPAQDALYTSTDAYGQVEATLALAFEQRTANLIAFWATIPRSASDGATRELRKEILERLGLNV